MESNDITLDWLYIQLTRLISTDKNLHIYLGINLLLTSACYSNNTNKGANQMRKGKVSRYKLVLKDGSIKYIWGTVATLNEYSFNIAIRLTPSHREYNAQ